MSPDTDLAVFASTPGAKQITEYVWDTYVPEVSLPWPHHDMEDLDLRGMLVLLTGRTDVTGWLYERAELERMLEGPQSWNDHVTGALKVVEVDP